MEWRTGTKYVGEGSIDTTTNNYFSLPFFLSHNLSLHKSYTQRTYTNTILMVAR